MPGSRHVFATAFLAWAALGACGRPDLPPATQLRLWLEGQAELVLGPPPAPPRSVLDDADEPEGWRAVVIPGREGSGPSLQSVEVEGRRALELAGAHGGIHRVVPVEPDTCYVLAGEILAEGIEAEESGLEGTKPDRARLWLAEASDEASFEELRGPRSDLLAAEWVSASAEGGQGWLRVRHLFVTRTRTRFLHLACVLATNSTLAAGRVRFAGLRLELHPRASAWIDRLQRDSAQRAIIDPPAAGDQHRRRLSAELGGETRPSLVLLPGERLRFPLPELAPGARLSLGAGAWPPDALPHRTTDPRTAGLAAQLAVRVDGQLVLERSFAPSRHPNEARWEPCALAVPDGARELELAAPGELPLVLGTPRIDGPRSHDGRPSLLLVSIDTLRADHLGARDARGSLTPNLDRLAQAGLLCRDASAPAPYTLPSHATLLTGQFPSVHGVVAHESRLSAARSTSLAELLARSGYATRAFTAGGFVHPVFGLDQGFEAFTQIDPVREVGSHFYRTLARRIGEPEAERRTDEQGFAGVERWLRAQGGAPFFLFLHTYTVHDYDAPPAYLPCTELGCARPPVPHDTPDAPAAAAFTSEMRAHVQHLYAAALRYTDERLGRLLALLAELGLQDDTLIVVTSDHGEEFFEHGLLQHGHTLYEELLRVPLLFHGAGIEPHALAGPAMLVDVVPTVLARLGLPRAEHVQGVDLLGPAWPERAVWSEVDSRFARKYALREPDGTKTIQGPATSGNQRANAPAWEHYDLTADPHELRDLAERDSGTRARARERLERHRRALEELGRALGAAGAGELGADELAELEALGYAGE